MLIRVRGASLNFLDLLVARGEYPITRFPLIPVCDGAGEVAELGEGVEDLAVGQPVIAHYMPGWQGGPMTAAGIRRQRGVTADGAMAEFVTAPAQSLAPVPGHLSFGQAATLPIAGTTAWNAIRAARVRPGSTVLVLGTGGVSLFALQFAKAAGARVIVTSSADEKLSAARGLGADETINYRANPVWDEEVLRVTGGTGADLVVETGGAETFPRSLSAVAVGGRIQVVGFLSGFDLSFQGLPLNLKAITVAGTNCGSVETFRDMVRAVAEREIVPVVAGTFPAENLDAAYEELAKGGLMGKVTIDGFA